MESKGSVLKEIEVYGEKRSFLKELYRIKGKTWDQ